MEIEPKAQANGVTQVQAIFQNISNNVKAYVVQKGRFFDPARKFQTVEVCKTKVLTFIFYELFQVENGFYTKYFLRLEINDFMDRKESHCNGSIDYV